MAGFRPPVVMAEGGGTATSPHDADNVHKHDKSGGSVPVSDLHHESEKEDSFLLEPSPHTLASGSSRPSRPLFTEEQEQLLSDCNDKKFGGAGIEGSPPLKIRGDDAGASQVDGKPEARDLPLPDFRNYASTDAFGTLLEEHWHAINKVLTNEPLSESEKKLLVYRQPSPPPRRVASHPPGHLQVTWYLPTDSDDDGITKTPSILSVKSAGKTLVMKTQGTKIATEELKKRVLELNITDENIAEDDTHKKAKMCPEDVQSKAVHEVGDRDGWTRRMLETLGLYGNPQPFVYAPGCLTTQYIDWIPAYEELCEFFGSNGPAGRCSDAGSSTDVVSVKPTVTSHDDDAESAWGEDFPGLKSGWRPPPDTTWPLQRGPLTPSSFDDADESDTISFGDDIKIAGGLTAPKQLGCAACGRSQGCAACGWGCKSRVVERMSLTPPQIDAAWKFLADS